MNNSLLPQLKTYNQIVDSLTNQLDQLALNPKPNQSISQFLDTQKSQITDAQKIMNQYPQYFPEGNIDLYENLVDYYNYKLNLDERFKKVAEQNKEINALYLPFYNELYKLETSLANMNNPNIERAFQRFISQPAIRDSIKKIDSIVAQNPEMLKKLAFNETLQLEVLKRNVQQMKNYNNYKNANSKLLTLRNDFLGLTQSFIKEHENEIDQIQTALSGSPSNIHSATDFIIYGSEHPQLGPVMPVFRRPQVIAVKTTPEEAKDLYNFYYKQLLSILLNAVSQYKGKSESELQSAFNNILNSQASLTLSRIQDLIKQYPTILESYDSLMNKLKELFIQEAEGKISGINKKEILDLYDGILNNIKFMMPTFVRPYPEAFAETQFNHFLNDNLFQVNSLIQLFNDNSYLFPKDYSPIEELQKAFYQEYEKIKVKN